MADPEDLTETIESNAAAPKKVTEGETTVEQHSLPDLIAADQHLEAKRARSAGRLGPTYARFVPPGTADC